MDEIESRKIVQGLMNHLNKEKLSVGDRLAVLNIFFATEISCAFISGEMKPDADPDVFIDDMANFAKLQVRDVLSMAKTQFAKRGDC